MGKLTARALDALGARLRSVVAGRTVGPTYDDATARRIQTACDEAGLGEALERWAASRGDYSVFTLSELEQLHDIICEATGEKNIFNTKGQSK